MGKAQYRQTPAQKEKKAFARYLSEDEELILATGFGKTYLRSYFIIGLGWPGIIFFIIGILLAYLVSLNLAYGLLTGLILASIVAYFRTLLTYHSHRYLLTNRRVIIKKGVFAVQVTSALFDKITHIEVVQPFFDKIIYHHGTIIINTAGANKDEIVLHFVDYPIDFKNLLEQLINREREQFGRQSGPVVTLEGEMVE